MILRPRIAKLAALAVLSVSMTLLSAPTHAATWARATEDAPLRLARNEGLSLEEAVAEVRSRTGGRILSAETRRANGETVHRIKVLTGDQRVRVIEVDARTGEWR